VGQGLVKYFGASSSSPSMDACSAWSLCVASWAWTLGPLGSTTPAP